MRIETKPLSGKSFLKKEGTVSKQDGNFADALKNIDQENTLEADLENSGGDFRKLADQLTQYGENLSKNPTPENFNEYKKHIKAFLSILMSNLEVHDTVSRVSFSKQKIYKTIETIDLKLSLIAKMILSNENNRLSYLKLVNGIKGLIIDLIM